ncbi:AP2/ERF domain-containing protein [Cinnamomum micranthum f. kanehirae]|uniref:AP2/ERF domain-containing protein n=1 Tax=Cinnamomum micranthum f. kanehirae TaxID=337451 RepID=A0A3S3QQ97_9MAGN|nr:AP2/ERF domain-containing protein [Cinnamomum micranthum f. kanehirae]
MEGVLVKREGNGGRRGGGAIEGEEPKCIKRRRREPSMAVVGNKDDKREVQDPSSTTTSNATAPVKRSSRFRGVSRHRWTGRYEAHLWDKGSWNVTQKKKGKQGAYDEEESAARAYDLAALKYWGPTTFTNFPVSDYEKEIQIMQTVTKEEYLASLRRKSSGFSRGVSKYRGVARHHHNGRWEARIGRVFGNKYLYLGTYSTQEEAAAAYDIAAIEYRGINAVTNFDLSTYIRWLRPGADATHKEPRANGESRAVTTSSTIYAKEHTQPFFNNHLFAMDDIGSPKKQEHHPWLISGSSNNKSSPRTALSVLLRSSIFRELVEKNSNASESEVEGDETKSHQHPSNDDDEFSLNYYNGIANVPYVCPTNDNTLVSMELQEESTSYYNRSGQSLWSNVLNMSSIH